MTMEIIVCVKRVPDLPGHLSRIQSQTGTLGQDLKIQLFFAEFFEKICGRRANLGITGFDIEVREKSKNATGHFIDEGGDRR